jgi:transcription elongation GreA/GreB family factor
MSRGDAVATAGVGSVVRVADRAGRISEYELVERSAAAAERVTLDSPVGQALVGARPGELIPITFGNGRRRRVRVLDVAAAA